jgi:hypothetical protein
METTIEAAELRKRLGSTLAPAGPQTAARRKAGGYPLGNGMAPEGIVWMRGFLASASASVAELLASASTVLTNAGAEVDVTGPGRLTVAGLPAERPVVLLSEHAIAFSEVTAHRAAP